jgi:hypothetical protein
MPAEATASDWGAGAGDRTRVLRERARTASAAEPGPALRDRRAANCPAAHVLGGTLLSADPPEQAHVAVRSHVPEHQWGAHVSRAANVLAPEGVLPVALKGPDCECNRMLEEFGAPPFDLLTGRARVARRHKECDVCFSHNPHTPRTTSFEDTLRVARLMMAGRAEAAFPGPPTESQFPDYVRGHFGDEGSKAGGRWVGDVYCLIRRNPRWT